MNTIGKQERYRVVHDLTHATRAVKDDRVIGYGASKDPETGLKTIWVTYSTQYTHDPKDNICGQKHNIS